MKPLRVSAYDAHTIANVYEKNGNSTVSIILDSDVTREAVLSRMKCAIANAGAKDAVIFFFSGHGPLLINP